MHRYIFLNINKFSSANILKIFDFDIFNNMYQNKHEIICCYKTFQ